MAARKEVSVGEYDALSGLTHITLQRGRLLFKMGPPSAKRAAAETAETAASGPRSSTPSLAAAAAADDASGQLTAETSAPLRRRERVFRSGISTGRSIYAEEAVYLVQRGALVVYAAQETAAPTDDPVGSADGDEQAAPPPGHQAPREPLTLAQLAASAVRHGFASSSSLDVYAFLKDNKLHPRRRVTATPSRDDRELTDAAARDAPPIVVFDVFKSMTETQLVPVESVSPPRHEGQASPREPLPVAAAADPAAVSPVKMRKRKLKRPSLIFRVVVRSFRDEMPSPRALRALVDDVQRGGGGGERGAETAASASAVNTGSSPPPPVLVVPVKLAVVDDDRSVLLFEVA